MGLSESRVSLNPWVNHNFPYKNDHFLDGIRYTAYPINLWQPGISHPSFGIPTISPRADNKVPPLPELETWAMRFEVWNVDFPTTLKNKIWLVV